MLAKYACSPFKSRGRAFPEKEDKAEIFLRDREKIIHSSAFRRLEYKTQVFVNHVGDHYRTRLTHTIEVSQIARNISRKLQLNEDLAESVALAHDLGHPPFGHAGEEGLNAAAKEFGGFDHNAHTIRILVKIEQRYLGFAGLNLSIETLDGIAKHNGPLNDHNSKSHMHLVNLLSDLELDPHIQPTLEAQCAALSDDIAYINHDIDDGLRANMFCLEELESLPITVDILKHLRKATNEVSKIKNELVKELSSIMIDDLVTQTLTNLKSRGIADYEDVKSHTHEIVSFSNDVAHAKGIIKSFLMEKVYKNYRVNRMTAKSKKLLSKLFDHYLQNPDCLPTEWYNKITYNKNKSDIAKFVIDYIAGMTDRYAIEEYKRLFDPSLF
jgi:dGTPase